MTEEELRNAIAEACGWQASGPRTFVRGGTDEDSEVAWDITYLPDYLHDLNAMHEAEKVLTPKQRERFEATLEQIVREAFYRLGTHHSPHCSSATAAQRSEAFIRTTGKRK